MAGGKAGHAGSRPDLKTRAEILIAVTENGPRQEATSGDTGLAVIIRQPCASQAIGKHG